MKPASATRCAPVGSCHLMCSVDEPEALVLGARWVRQQGIGRAEAAVLVRYLLPYPLLAAKVLLKPAPMD